MLIETPLQNGDTISLKLSSGEEIVARLEEETPTKFILKAYGINYATRRIRSSTLHV